MMKHVLKRMYVCCVVVGGDSQTYFTYGAQALVLLDEAVAIEDGLGYMEPLLASTPQHSAKHTISSQALVLLDEAVAIEDGLGYMEPPRAHAPARQCLGTVLLRAGKLGEAADVYQKVREGGALCAHSWLPASAKPLAVGPQLLLPGLALQLCAVKAH